MAKRAGNAKKVALGGTMSALSLGLMLVGSILPFSQYVAVVLAGLVPIIVYGAVGPKYAVCVYGTVSILSLILLPIKELALLFFMLFGYYPLIKYKLDCMGKFFGTLVKLVLFNISMTIAYLITIYLFTTPELQQLFQNYKIHFIALIYIIGNIFFVVYDRFVFVAWRIYFIKIAPIMKKIF